MGAGALAFGELMALQRVVYERCGEEFLGGAVAELGRLGCTQEVVQQYVHHLQQDDQRSLKAFALNLCKNLPKPQPQ